MANAHNELSGAAQQGDMKQDIAVFLLQL